MKEDILKSYDRVSLEYIGNSNSLHKLGLDSKRIEEASTKQILEVLELDDYEVIYTSGNAESFTTLISNVRGKIWTDNKVFEDVCNDMNVSCFENKKDIYLVSTLKDKNFFGKYNHIDVNLSNSYENLNKFDFITIEDEIPFFGVLIKRKNIDLLPLIHGGKSSTKYRSGTAVTPLIVSFAKLIKLKYKK
ncbi:MAG: hypothetical protein ACI31R_00360 [Bacilli bacterium]